MKKIITIVISCSLALAAGAMAQQETASATPNKKQQRKEHAASAAQSPSGSQAQQPEARPRAGRRARERAAATENANPQTPAAEAPNASPKSRPNPPGIHRKGHNANRESAPANQSVTPAAAKPNDVQTQGGAQAPVPSQKGNAQANTNNGSSKPKKPADVQKIKTQHANFRAQPKPEQVPAVTFSQSRQISGSENWQGEKYNAFRSYRPERHDQGWYRSRYNRIELIGGGYYYFNNGYWYPAWGYQPSAQYYVYDGPIYVGRQAEPPDRVIADVQASLQEMGYYKGEVDGLLGPLTREALTAYQSDNGLYTTAAIDEPTLESLGLG
jgi:hypothetical protein